MKKYILLAFIGITFLSCSNNDDSNENVFVLYNQTNCSDPWGYSDDNKELEDKINNYLKEENIEISNVTINNDGTAISCNACFCLSGKRIVGKVSRQDLESIKEFGFEELN
ncbi:hypothetical protein [Maribacter cobaltidurans]|uniref:Uncharacterized protein n=1 Tax=Maribacter cobaltidurans TaxID=1178778 RepID=A0A223V5G5_9FLAO|nr:hypothetical protein [Maribacter cobaltidurans]ASV30437.1 hypothetical protein CJ263_09550 [Maribacter cobaltidurans]GGD78655.1 hypothetical protein GCM10011412_15580 [Maribacter cobaltidurans]